MSLSRDPNHPGDRLPDEETEAARRRRERKQDQDAAGLVHEENRSQELGDETDRLQRKMWGDRAAIGAEVSDEFTSRRLFEWLDL